MAKKNNLTKDDLPTTLLIISDMEFDAATRGSTNFEAARQLFEQYGYELPEVVFWNANGRPGNVPITVNDKGVALVSGASPAVVKSVLTGELDPETIMLKALNSERYSILNV